MANLTLKLYTWSWYSWRGEYWLAGCRDCSLVDCGRTRVKGLKKLLVHLHSSPSTLEEVILVFQWRDSWWFLALALDIQPEFLWVGVKIITDYFFQLRSVHLFDVQLQFGSACSSWCLFSSQSSCSPVGMLFSPDSFLHGGVYPEIVVPCCCGFRGHSFLSNAQDCLLEIFLQLFNYAQNCLLKICPKLFYGSGQHQVCYKGTCLFLQVLSTGINISSLPQRWEGGKTSIIQDNFMVAVPERG